MTSIGSLYVEQRKSSIVSVLDLWSVFSTIQVTTVATTQALPSITIIGLPVNVKLVRAIVAVKFRAISEHLSADTDLLNDQQVQIMKAIGGTWVTGLTLLDGQLICLADAREYGDVLIGSVDVKEQVPANDEEVNIQWVNSRVSAGELHLEDLQTGLRIWFTALSR